MQTRILEHTGHAGTKPEGYSRGLQWSFKKAVVSLTTAQLRTYEGNYLLGTDTIKIKVEKDVLVAIAGNQKIKLTAETEQDFYVQGRYLQVHCNKDKENKVSGCKLESFDGCQCLKKLN